MSASFAQISRALNRLSLELADIQASLNAIAQQQIILPHTASSRVREFVDHATPMEDVFFRLLVEDPEVCREIVSAILGADVKVISVIPQYDLPNIMGRSLVLDALVRIEPVVSITVQLLGDCNFGKAGAFVNIELQNRDDDDLQCRARLHEGLITVSNTPTGSKFTEIPNVITIFISAYDALGSGNMIEVVDRVARRSGIRCSNGAAEVYLNTANQENLDDPDLSPSKKNFLARVSELTALLSGAVESSPSFPAFSSRSYFLKHTTEGVIQMTEAFQALIDAERADALAEAVAARKEADAARKEADAARAEANTARTARTDASEVIAQFVSGLQKQGHTLEDIARNFGINSAKLTSFLPTAPAANP